MSRNTVEGTSNIPTQAPETSVFELSAADNIYDLFKHMTTLSLVSLGGVMTIVSEGIVAMKPEALALVVGLIAVGGIGAYSGMMVLSEVKVSGKDRPKRVKFYRRITSLGYGMGMGAFLSVFLTGVLA